ncbi:MAG: hypothetical protein NC308_06435 [Clostridium sp.]|nr:hypothetical protein [Bacteroides sp.]MCM1198509.1 hypothetical protein [Clostridium sp.]
MKSKYLLILLAFILTACNRYIQFEDSFVYFDLQSSSSTNIYEMADMTGEYWLHLTSKVLDTQLTVYISIESGDGLTEGIDYEIISGNEIKFIPGIYNMPFRIRFMKNEIDKEKDNSIKLIIDEASDPNVCLGMPGPDKLARTIAITKYSL